MLLVAIGIGTYHFYRDWAGKRLVRRAETYLAWGDLKSAVLTARRAVQVDRTNAEAYRVLAKISERDGQPAAIEWRQAALEASRGAIDDEIALAQTALQFDKISIAENELAKIRATADQIPAYHEAKAKLALARKAPAEAEKHFSEAVRLDPSKEEYQLDLAVLQLQSSSSDIQTHARQTLEKLLKDKQLRLRAGRALRERAAQQKDVPAFLEIADTIYKYPEATFRDKLAYIQALHALENADFASRLAELQEESIREPSKLTELLSWMAANNLALFAIHWVKSLPADVVDKPPVPVAVADCYVMSNDWPGLQNWCKNRNWGKLDFFRHAYLSRALREQGDNLGFQSEWNIALQQAGSDSDRLYGLERATAKWNWSKEIEDLLWKLANDPTRQEAALAALYQHYIDQGDTPDLYRVVVRLSEIRPNDDDSQNNLAQLGLLLNLDMEHAHDLAERLHGKEPDNPVFTSTYAFSMFRRGKAQQAVKIMSGLSAEDLRKPPFAAYYAIFLVASGQGPLAREFLKIGKEARLLPEEKALFDSAAK